MRDFRRLGVTGCNDSVELAYKTFMSKEWTRLRCVGWREVE